MYYITNQNDQIIAASSALLDLLKLENADALYRQIALNAIEFSTDEEGITVKTPKDEAHYHADRETLSSVLGTMTLVRLTTEIFTENTVVEQPVLPEKAEEKEDDFSLLDDDEVLFGIKEDTVQDDISMPLEVKEAEKEATEEEEENDLFDLILPSKAEETIGEIEDKEVTAKASAPVYIDVEQISKNIGISQEDYNTFLTEYIDTALSLEEDLRSDDNNKRTAATHTLFHLSNVLQLPIITEIIEQLKYTESEDIDSSIQHFYDTLSRLTTSKPENTEKKETTVSVEREEGPSENFKSFGTIDLSDVKPIHFDFQVEEAAKELSLPPELIEEFIHDFIKQAHEETDKMLKAYEKGDLDTIQKIGHLLKGTASNLRINPLSDTLYEIQFCEDSSQLEKLIKDYWAHFISFETQFNLKSK